MAANAVLNINSSKTEYKKILRTQGSRENTRLIDGHNFQRCKSFLYLRALVTEVNDVKAEIKARIMIGSRRLFAMNKVLSFR